MFKEHIFIRMFLILILCYTVENAIDRMAEATFVLGDRLATYNHLKDGGM